MAQQIKNESNSEKYRAVNWALMGLRNTEHSVAMMQNANGEESPVTINDLVEPDGTAAGTEVVIKMPVIE